MLYLGHDETENILPNGDVKSKGDLMVIDLYSKAAELLARIANSVHERDPKNANLLFFSSTEVEIVKEWLRDFIDETTK